MFDDRVYKRGALTLHALRGRLGDENFFALLQDWTTRHRHSTVVTDDFTGLAANYSASRCARCGMPGCTRRRCHEDDSAAPNERFKAGGCCLGAEIGHELPSASDVPVRPRE